MGIELEGLTAWGNKVHSRSVLGGDVNIHLHEIFERGENSLSEGLLEGLLPKG
jgi:hypothetical protein